MYISGDWIEKNNQYLFFRSTLYGSELSPEDIFNSFFSDPVKFVNEIKGDFIIIFYDAKTDKLTFCSDRLGKDYIYYFVDNEKIVLASDIWSAARVLKPSINDINWQAVKRLVIFNNMLIRHSYINNLEMISPATIYNYDGSSKRITSQKYWEMKFCEDKNLTLNETVEKLDELFDRTFQKISQKYNKETRFGVGLSGGWDTRIIVHYANKYKLRLVPYCVGQKRQLLFFPTYGFLVAKRIAKYFKLNNFKFIDYKSEDVGKKFAREVLMLPERASNMEIGCLSKIPEFDIMLNGEHGGVFFGEFNWEPILNYTKSDISGYFLNFLVFNSAMDLLLSEQETMFLKSEIQAYVNNMDTNDQYEIVYKYFYEVLGAQSKRGFFETNYDTKERYTPYLDPDFFDFYLTWNAKFRMDRVLQRSFFIKKLTKLSKMADEASDAPLFWRSINVRDVPYRFYYAALNYLFKPSLRRSVWLKKDKKFNKIYNTVIERNMELINTYFPNFDSKLFIKKNPRAASTFIKAIATVDALINSFPYENVENYVLTQYLRN